MWLTAHTIDKKWQIKIIKKTVQETFNKNIKTELNPEWQSGKFNHEMYKT